MIEAGVPNFVSDTWNALSAPPKTPAPIVGKLNQAVNDIIGAPEIKKQFEELNLLPAGGSPAAMAKFVKEETLRWTEVIHRSSRSEASRRSRASGPSRNDVGRELVLDEGNAVPQVELALFQPLDLQHIRPWRFL